MQSPSQLLLSPAAQWLNHKMTMPARLLVKFVPYRGSCKTSNFGLLGLTAVVGAVADTETPIHGLAVALVLVTTLQGYAGTTGRLGKTPSDAVLPALLRETGTPGTKRGVSHISVVADVLHPIIGADFLKRFNLSRIRAHDGAWHCPPVRQQGAIASPCGQKIKTRRLVALW